MTSMKMAKLKWANKLARARYFVVLTDKESVIAFDGANPRSFTDILALEAQASEIDNFLEALKELRTRHSDAIDRLQEKENKRAKRTSAAKAKAKSSSK